MTGSRAHSTEEPLLVILCKSFHDWLMSPVKPDTGHCFSNLWHPHPGLAPYHFVYLTRSTQAQPDSIFHEQRIQVLDLEMMLVWWDSIFTSWLDVWRFLGAKALEVPRNRGLGEARRTPDLRVIFQPREFQRCLFCVLFFARTLSCAAKRHTNTHKKNAQQLKVTNWPSSFLGVIR